MLAFSPPFCSFASYSIHVRYQLLISVLCQTSSLITGELYLGSPSKLHSWQLYDYLICFRALQMPQEKFPKSRSSKIMLSQISREASSFLKPRTSVTYPSELIYYTVCFSVKFCWCFVRIADVFKAVLSVENKRCVSVDHSSKQYVIENES